jgi:hypothetical protein
MNPTPTNEAIVRNAVAIIDDCVVCGGRHVHGAPGGAIDGPAPRRAHCESENVDTYYVIQTEVVH